MHDMLNKRVEIPVHFDSWMRGDRYGLVERVTRLKVWVRMDRSGRLLRINRETMMEWGKLV